jgi:NAD(P)-dependent dehydrogenase (short-subunit alcohol dehydrogenase family)
VSGVPATGRAGRLEGKVAIVTGAGPGIGRSIAALFAAEGARVTLVDLEPTAARETERRIRDAGGHAVVVEGDAASAADWARVLEVTIAEHGGVDVLVNGAAPWSGGAVLDIDEAVWDRALAVGLTSVYLGARACLPRMVERGGGAIVSISSANGLVANPGFADYITAKTGVIGLSRSIALDYGRQGIRSNVICPGLIVNETTEPALLADADEARGSRDPYLVGRWGAPEDVAYAALYLASDEAAFVTGTVLVVDGGLTCQSPEATIRPSFRERWRDDLAVIRDRGPA